MLRDPVLEVVGFGEEDALEREAGERGEVQRGKVERGDDADVVVAVEAETRERARERERAEDPVLDRVLPERKSSVLELAGRGDLQGRSLVGERGQRAEEGLEGGQVVERVVARGETAEVERCQRWWQLWLV